LARQPAAHSFEGVKEPGEKEHVMGSKSSKWLTAALAAAVVGAVPAGAVAKLDYSKNSVSGQYLPSPARVVPQINDVSTPTPTANAQAPVRIVTAPKADSGFDIGAALAGGGATLLLALMGVGVARRRHPSPLAG
jgi:hypothetical protein